MLFKGSVRNDRSVLEEVGLLTAASTGTATVQTGALVIRQAMAASTASVNTHFYKPAASYDGNLEEPLKIGALALVTGGFPSIFGNAAAVNVNGVSAPAEPRGVGVRVIRLYEGDIIESEIDLTDANQRLTPVNLVAAGAPPYTKRADFQTTVGSNDINSPFWYFGTAGGAAGELALTVKNDPDGNGNPQTHAFPSTAILTGPLTAASRGFSIPAASNFKALGISSDFTQFKHFTAGEPQLTVREVREAFLVPAGKEENAILLDSTDFYAKTDITVTGTKAKIRVVL